MKDIKIVVGMVVYAVISLVACVYVFNVYNII